MEKKNNYIVKSSDLTSFNSDGCDALKVMMPGHLGCSALKEPDTFCVEDGNIIVRDDNGVKYCLTIVAPSIHDLKEVVSESISFKYLEEVYEELTCSKIEWRTSVYIFRLLDGFKNVNEGQGTMSINWCSKWYGLCPVDNVLEEYPAEESPDGVYTPWSLRAY